MGSDCGKLCFMDFREYTPEELAEELMRLGVGLDAVCVEVQAADGTVIARDAMRLSLSLGHDFDRAGGYTWVTVTARLDA